MPDVRELVAQIARGNATPPPIAKLLGFSITGLASSQGSSFWFDILVKIINVRSAGKRPA